MRTYEYRLYPNREQRRRLDAFLYESRLLYNEMLEREKQHYIVVGQDAYLPLVRVCSRSRRERRPEYLKGGGTAFGDGGR
jgi:transposase